MKHLYRNRCLFMMLFLAVFPSCESFLEEKVYSDQIPENFYSNAAEADGALRGILNVYSGNTNYQLLNMEEYLTDNVSLDAARLLTTDHNLQFSKKNIKSTNTIVESVYSSLYASIYNCNAFIYYMENTTWDDAGEEAQRPQYIAEAYTFRAMAYFKLVRLWGAVPLIVDFSDNTPEGPIRIGRTSVEEVYRQIIDDLKKSETLYLQEDQRSVVFPGKILSRLILAEVYLTMAGEPLNLGTEYLEAARAEADTLIHAKADGIEVPELVNFEDVFSVENENRGEILLSEQNYGPASGQIWATGVYSYGALSFDLIREFDTSGPVDLANSDRDIRGVDPDSDTYDVSLYSDESNFIDARFYPTFWPYKGKWNADTKTLPGFYNVLNYLSDPSKYSSGTINKTVFPGKYRMDYEFRAGVNASYPHYDKKANVILYRWAEAFLIYAEADNELNGPQPEAIEAVNKIRHRAALEDLPDAQIAGQDVFRNAIRKEWRLEFVDEGKRFYNLKRWGILIDKVNSFVNEYNSYNESDPMDLLTKGKNEVYPIPFNEIERTGFAQNPGY